MGESLMDFQRVIGDKTITVSAGKVFESQVNVLFAVLEGVPDKLIHAFSFQIGWSIYYLQERKPFHYVVVTHDVAKNPFEYMIDDLTLALSIQSQQVDLLRKINVGGLNIQFSDTIVLSKDVLSLDNVYLQRSGDVEQGDSGWYIGPLDGSGGTDLYAIYAYELLKIKPELVQVLSLPNDFIAVFNGDEIKAILNENDVNLLKNA